MDDGSDRVISRFEKKETRSSASLWFAFVASLFTVLLPLSSSNAFSPVTLDPVKGPSWPQSEIQVSISGLSSGCFTLDDLRKKLADATLTDKFDQGLATVQQQGWIVRQACIQDYYYDQNTSKLKHVVYLLLAKVTQNADGVDVGDVRIAVWDESREWTAKIAGKGSGLSLSTPIHLPVNVVSYYLRPSLTSVWRNNQWYYSTVFSVVRYAKDNIYRTYYRYDPWAKTTRRIYSCWFEDSGNRTPEKACRSINAF